jgi:hypothetical protein
MKLNEMFKIVCDAFEIACEMFCGFRSWKGTIMQPRRFARVRPTGKVSSTAKIIVGPKAPVIDCNIVDYSAGGACLQVYGETRLPNRFELLFGGTRKRCRVVWSVGRRLGVTF